MLISTIDPTLPQQDQSISAGVIRGQFGAAINDINALYQICTALQAPGSGAAIPTAALVAPPMDGVAAVGSSVYYARQDHVHPTDTSRYAAANPAGYQTAANLTSALAPYALTSALPVASSTTPLVDGTAAIGTNTGWARGDHVHPTDTSRYAASNPSGYIAASGAPVQTVFGRTGAVVLAAGDVTTALGFAPYSAANPNGYQTAAQVAAVLPGASSTTPIVDGVAAIGTSATFARADHVHPTDTSRYAASNPSSFITAAGAPVQSVFGRTGAVALASADVTTALTFTPYNATNPLGYQTAAQVAASIVPIVATVAALRANNGSILNGVCYVLGWYAAADGGGGFFVHNAADVSSVDNGGTIVLDTGGWRWYRDRVGDVFSVEWFGAKGDNVTNDQAAIQSCMNYVASITAGTSTTGGGTVLFPKGDYYITTGLVISTSGVKLQGTGRGAMHDTAPYAPGGTRLLWGSATDTTSSMVTFTPASTTVQKLTDVACVGITLVGTPAFTSGPSCAYGLKIVSCQHSTFDVFTVELGVSAVMFTCNGDTSEASNNEGCTTSLRFRQENTLGTALTLGGANITTAGASNTCFCHFPYVYGYIAFGTGIDLQDCDNNTFDQVWIDSIENYATPSTSIAGSGFTAGSHVQPRSIVFRGQTSAGHAFPAGGARANTFNHFSGSVHTNLVYSEGTETANVTVPAYANRIDYFDNSNQALTLQTGTGASLFWAGNMNPTAMHDSGTSAAVGYRIFSDGFTVFWGSGGSFGAGTSNTITLGFSCSAIFGVNVNYAGSGANVGACASGFVASGATMQFTLYAPATGYYFWTGYCQR